MSDEHNKNVGKSFSAILVNGETYYLGNKRFDAKVPQTVTKEEADTLRMAATEQSLLNPDETYTSVKKPRFEITEISPKGDDAPDPVRTRTRVAAAA